VNQAMKKGYNQYAPMPGIFSLREVISSKILELYGKEYDPDSEITVTAGATQAIFTIITAFVHQDDEVIIFAPAYDSYDPTIRLNGGKTVEIPLKKPDFKIDWKKVKSSVTDKTRMIIINSPHNPTGTVLDHVDMLELQQIVEDTNIIVLSDEVYEHLIYDGRQHQSIARFPGIASRGFLVASFGKTFHNTGWKVGYCAGPRFLMDEFRKVHQFNVFSVNHPVQRALAIYLKEKENYLSLPIFFQRKRDLFLNAIKDSKFTFKPSEGTYFQLLDYSKISAEGDMVLAKKWTKKEKVASIPVSVFYKDRTDHKVLRFCFAKSDETLLRGAEILNRLPK
jgi:methionine aminotransferase